MSVNPTATAVAVVDGKLVPTPGLSTKPLDMVLHCPRCGTQHVDAPDPETGWTNPVHRSHECQSCKTVWRPADVPTNGVASVATKGKADTWEPGGHRDTKPDNTPTGIARAHLQVKLESDGRNLLEGCAQHFRENTESERCYVTREEVWEALGMPSDLYQEEDRE